MSHTRGSQRKQNRSLRTSVSPHQRRQFVVVVAQNRCQLFSFRRNIMFKIKHTVLSTLSALALGLTVTSINAAGAGMGGMGSSTGSGGMGSNAGSGSMGSNAGSGGMGSNAGSGGMGSNAGSGGMGSNAGSGSMGSNAGSGSMGDMSTMDGKGSMTISTNTPAVK